MARRPRRTSDPLDERSSAILRAVIDEYVDSAAPVSSGALVDHYALGVSSATVRNILAELETLGLLSHPHTSAGRVPTDAGYRYYVQVLADEWSMPPVEQRMIRHQFGQVEFASEQWFRLAASTLAAATGTAGLATSAKPKAVRGGGDRWRFGQAWRARAFLRCDGRTRYLWWNLYRHDSGKRIHHFDILQL